MRLNASGTGKTAAEDLCLACGLCCNGVIFADVKLRRGDDPARLKALGLPLTSPAPTTRWSAAHRPAFRQPCVAHDGCRCGIYAERPVHCRQFECALLKKFNAGKVTSAAARGVVKQARNRAEDVKQLLGELGDTEATLALSERFRRTSSRLHDIGFDQPSTEAYGRLTLALHDLNFILHEEFYPSPAASA